MTVSQKIITGNDQPNAGRGVVGVSGARGLDASSSLDDSHTLEPAPVPSDKIDQSISEINSALNERFDDQDYYPQ